MEKDILSVELMRAQLQTTCVCLVLQVFNDVLSSLLSITFVTYLIFTSYLTHLILTLVAVNLMVTSGIITDKIEFVIWF